MKKTGIKFKNLSFVFIIYGVQEMSLYKWIYNALFSKENNEFP